MRSLVVVGLVFLFSGCAILEPDFGVSKESVTPIVKENNETDRSLKEDIIEEHIIENVFDDELYFEKDKGQKNLRRVVIKYLDAYSWEKKALRVAYSKHKRLWSKRQSRSFRKILEEDRYLSLCSDRRYWDNLEFEQSEPERDILHSILLLRYVNNLSYGCIEWVKSEGKVKDENQKRHIHAKHILSLLPHELLIEKLLKAYAPKDKYFFSKLKEYKKFVELGKSMEELKEERLEIESYKLGNSKLDYKKRER